MTPQPDLFNTVFRICFSFRFPSVSLTNGETSVLQTVRYMTLFLDITIVFLDALNGDQNLWRLHLHKLTQSLRGMLYLTFLQLTHVRKHTVSVVFCDWKLRCWALIIKQPYVRREQCPSEISILSLTLWNCVSVCNMGSGPCVARVFVNSDLQNYYYFSLQNRKKFCQIPEII